MSSTPILRHRARGSNVVPLRLVPPAIDVDVIHCLKNLLEGAQGGHVTGLAFAATLKGGRYITNVAGACRTDLTHARGMLSVLSEEVGDMIYERQHSDPTAPR